MQTPGTQPGLLPWSNSIRLSMANDPGRQLFHDQVNTHGFLFLQQYLDNILSGAKQDPLIDLVKTPGRKKQISKKPKPASKLNKVVSLSLGDIVDEKENISPINTFHEALLKAKTDAYEPATHTSALQSIVPSSQQVNVQERETFFTIDSTPVPPVDILVAAPSVYSEDRLAPSHSEPNELSVIAEDDENVERSRASIQGQPTSKSPDGKRKSTINESTSDTFHSIALDSPQLPPPPRSPSPISMHPPLAPTLDNKLERRKPSGSYMTLPEDLASRPSSTNTNTDTVTVPTLSRNMATAPRDPVQDSDAPLCDQVISSASPKGPIHNSTFSLFPSLPAPMPLRKSMRSSRDPSMGAATPGAGLSGKRTSWLKKAREAKALEVTGKKNAAAMVAVALSVPSLPKNLKRKSGDTLIVPTKTGLEDEERQYKVAKNIDGDVASLKLSVPDAAKNRERLADQFSPEFLESHSPPDGMLDRFKRTVEDLGARVGKSMGKSLGAVAAASALAEARAAAEARVAERNNKEDEMTRDLDAPTAPHVQDEAFTTDGNRPASSGISQSFKPAYVSGTTPSRETERRLSVSDLFPPDDGSAKIKRKIAGKKFQLAPADVSFIGEKDRINRESTTTTPPDSPPATRPTSLTLPPGPVFNKPPPVFVAPSPPSKAQSPPVKDVPSEPVLHLLSRLSQNPSSLTAHSTLESLKSDAIFDDSVDSPAWLPMTQDTDYSSKFGSQEDRNIVDEDDSWPIDEKLAAGVQWTFGSSSGKEDSMTWSTLPSQSQRADTGRQPTDQTSARDESEKRQIDRVIPGYFDVNMGEEAKHDLDLVDDELEDIVMAGKPAIGFLETKTTRSQSQMSMASSISSQSQPGLLGQASKLLSSALGTSKKGKPEVKKVLQMAAVAAKRQQEEDDKKAARLKEMENRRQLAIQRKAEEEKARTQEQERKLKEEGERRKRDREEHTDKRPLKPVMSGKKDEDTTKKRKITVEIDKGREIRKPAPKTALKSSMKQPAALSSSAVYNASLQALPTLIPKATEVNPSKSTITAVQKGKGKAPANNTPITEDDISQPSQLVQIQMAARAKAQLQAAKQAVEPSIQSENIELPDINSEYSDSDDEDRPRTFDPPNWAQSPELREALQIQSTINPDDIFGAIRPLRMEELFRTRTSRFRARTSSANWTGADRLTAEEEREYARRMGFK